MQSFGAYQVVQLLGQGGMGRVFEVRDPAQPGRRLALKQALAGTLGPTGLSRFRREGELLARVRHPNVVAVHALGEAPEGPWLVMDLVEGESLGDRLKRAGRLGSREAARIVADLASAVAALHEQGVLHRDLKPDNAILRADGTPVLIDFGLAWSDDVERLTRSGVVIGSPAFLPPEQAGARDEIDERSDVYGLGATLFALVVGRAPFGGGGAMEVVKKVLHDPPRWPTAKDLGGEPLPRPLRRLLARTLAKARADRPRSARELEALLRAHAEGRDGASRGPLLAAGALALLVLAALAALLLRGRSPAPAPTQPPETPAPADPGPPDPAPGPAPIRPRTRPPQDTSRPRVLRAAGGEELGVGCDALGVVTWTRSGPAGRLTFWHGLAASSGKHTVLWEGAPLLLVSLHPGLITLLTGGPQGTRCLSQPVLPVASRASELTLDELPPEPVTALATLPPKRELRRLAVATWDGRAARVWVLDPRRPPGGPSLELRCPKHLGPARALALHPDGRGIVVLGEGGAASWELPAELDARRELGQPRHVLAVEGSGVPAALALDPQGQAWAGCSDGTIRPLELEQGQLGRSRGEPHGGPVVAVCFAPEGWVYSLSVRGADGTGREELRCWQREGDAWHLAGGVSGWDAPLGPSLSLTVDSAWVAVAGAGRAELWPVGLLRQGLRQRGELGE